MDAVTISSVALGVVSIFISGFAIWLSLQFNDRSAKALEAISNLASDIRSMTEVSLTHQKDFSSKMLDSLIEMNTYGRPFPGADAPTVRSLEDIVSRRIGEQTQTLADTVQMAMEKITQTQPAPVDLEAEIQAITQEFRKLIDPSRDGEKASPLTAEQSQALKSFIAHPAHYVLLTAVLMSEAHSIDDLRKVADRYHVPSGYEGGILHLIEKGFLKGRAESFSISPELRAPLTTWVEKNLPTLTKLMSYYADRKGLIRQASEQEKANELRF